MSTHSQRIGFSGNDIAITGMGAVCSIGDSVEEIRQALICGKSGLSPICGFDASGFGGVAAQVKEPPAIKTDISPQLAKTMGKHLSLLLKSAAEALEHSGLRPGTFAPEDIGFYAAMGMVDYRIEDLLPAVASSLDHERGLDYDKFFATGYREIYPLWPLGMLNNVAFCQAAIHFGLRGENCVFSPHADAGVMALSEGVKVLREGRAKAVVAGGVSEEISPLSLARAKLGFSSEAGMGGCKTVSAIKPPPPTPSPYLGECAAMLVLEPLELAENRGASPIAVISGFGFSCDKDKMTKSVSVRAVLSSMEAALSQAEAGPDDIDLVMLGGFDHQSGLEAVRQLFHSSGRCPAVISSCRAIGEVFAAAPVIDSIIGINILGSAQVPKGLMSCRPLENQGLAMPSPVRTGSGRVLINAASYEGQCASLIIENALTRN